VATTKDRRTVYLRNLDTAEVVSRRSIELPGDLASVIWSIKLPICDVITAYWGTVIWLFYTSRARYCLRDYQSVDSVTFDFHLHNRSETVCCEEYFLDVKEGAFLKVMCKKLPPCSLAQTDKMDPLYVGDNRFEYWPEFKLCWLVFINLLVHWFI
jgi:hypothetical protein